MTKAEFLELINGLPEEMNDSPELWDNLAQVVATEMSKQLAKLDPMALLKMITGKGTPAPPASEAKTPVPSPSEPEAKTPTTPSASAELPAKVDEPAAAKVDEASAPSVVPIDAVEPTTEKVEEATKEVTKDESWGSFKR